MYVTIQRHFTLLKLVTADYNKIKSKKLCSILLSYQKNPLPLHSKLKNGNSKVLYICHRESESNYSLTITT